jgi:uncharacterized membrane protein
VSFDARLAIPLAAAAWLGLLITTPFAPVPLATVIYGVGSFICHQIPERSFHLGAFQLPVCGRCIGIYAGFAIAAAGIMLRRDHATQRRVLTSRAARRVFIISALPTAATVGLEWCEVWSGTNIVRALAGAALGVGVAVVVMGAVATLHYSSCAAPPSTEPNRLPPLT